MEEQSEPVASAATQEADEASPREQQQEVQEQFAAEDQLQMEGEATVPTETAMDKGQWAKVENAAEVAS
eukprot:11216350-Lingulodinium_polyedra.AAC.1